MKNVVSDLSDQVNSAPYFYRQVRVEGGKHKLVSDPSALRALLVLMDMYATLGGAASHFGGPSAFAEIVSALYAHVFDTQGSRDPWYQRYHIVNDAGHCENIHYAVKANYGFAGLQFSDLWRFRSLGSPLTGHGEVHLFPQGVLLSNGPLGSALAQSHGLALADANLGHWDRVTITLASDGALMEGEAREVLASIPGYAQKGLLAPYILIISDNNTKLSGRIDQDSFSMEPTFESMSQLGWEVVRISNGHHLETCYQTMSQAIQTVRHNPRKPVVLWFKTIKGYGHKASMESASGGHGFSLKSPEQVWSVIQEIYGSEQIPSEFQKWNQELLEWAKRRAQGTQAQGIKLPTSIQSIKTAKVQDGISRAMIRARQKGIPVVSITSDLPGSTGVAGFRKEFPSASYDVGVAEANMISAAAGASKVGLVPVVDTFAQFGTTKGALPLIMASLSKAPVIGIFSHIGFQDAADGASHQSLNYLGMTLGIPQVEVWSLSCAQEAERRITLALEEFWQVRMMGKIPPSYVFFLGRENFPIDYGNKPDMDQLPLRAPLICYRSPLPTKVVLCAIGSLVPQAVAAAYALEEQGEGSLVIHPGFLTRPNIEWWRPVLEQVEGRIVFIEDHQKIGGFAQHWTCEFLTQGISVKPAFVAVNGEFGRSAYQAQELYDEYGVGAQSIQERAWQLIRGGVI